ncbi:Oidioi.mRNA.OKI2018_I69.PAR.g10698.t1.cds [Oikopleura dioica]|uniref:Oidioi.mRNA.OKI2018_I69.PAR.g10698.t1.cds n=1 Tax=Oikopleura dioica TaxID=34765 RepID=A0ABN7RSR4_OIKDI|nr:Oidioi.mRNA.OKI2018_I69.PAR.g10698.t1.cds [Oikopleura dioica]
MILYKTNFLLSIFNLMNAILGSGILGLAYAVKSLGILLYIIMLMGVAGMAFYAITLLLNMCQITGYRSYEQIAEAAYGARGKLVAVICISVHTLGAMVSFLFICKYELPPVVKMFLGIDPCVDTWYTNGDVLTAMVVLFIVGPLAAAKDISFLGYTSGFAMGCMIFCTVLIVLQSSGIPCPLEPSMPDGYWQFMFQKAEEECGADWGELTKESYLADKYDEDLLANFRSNENFVLQNESCSLADPIAEFYHEVPTQSCTSEWISLTLRSAYAIPTMVFAFQCHASVLPIYAELKQPSKKKMQYVSTISIGLVFIMYLLASLFGYLTFKNATGPELFVMYSGYMPDDRLILFGRLMVLICVIFSAPLLHYPCRKALIVGIWGPEYMPGGKDFKWLIWLGTMTFILTAVVLMVIFVPGIKVVFGLAGATVATMLVIIMPAGFYYKLGPEPKDSTTKRINYAVVIAGFIFVIFSVSLLVYDMIKPKHEEHACSIMLDSLKAGEAH